MRNLEVLVWLSTVSRKEKEMQANRGGEQRCCQPRLPPPAKMKSESSTATTTIMLIVLSISKKIE